MNCKIIPQVEFPSLGEQYKTKRKKSGRYHKSMFWDIPKFGANRWVVVIKVDIGNRDILLKQMTEEELTNECLKIINPMTVIKKAQAPIYGNLEFYKFKPLGKYEANLLLVTDKRKHKSFWGEGVLISEIKRRS